MADKFTNELTLVSSPLLDNDHLLLSRDGTELGRTNIGALKNSIGLGTQALTTAQAANPIDLSLGSPVITLTANVTLGALSGMVADREYTITFKQDATGGRLPTVPAGISLVSPITAGLANEIRTFRIMATSASTGFVSYDSGWNGATTNVSNLLNYPTIPVGKTTYRGMSRVAPYIAPGNQIGRANNIGKYPKENVTRFFVRLTTVNATSQFSIGATELEEAKSDIALYGTYGVKTIIVLAVSGIPQDVFWASATSQSYYAEAVASFAKEFVGNINLLGIEVINEPDDSTKSGAAEWAQLKVFYESIIAKVRKFDSKRLLLLSSGNGSVAKQFQWITPVQDDYVGYVYHLYEPRPITHQNVPSDTTNANYPSASNYGVNYLDGSASYTDHFSLLNNISGLRRYLEPVKAFADKYGVSTWCLEFATTRRSPGTTSTTWTRDAITVMEEIGSNWIYWGDFNGDIYWSANRLPNNAQIAPYYPWASGPIDSLTPACVLTTAFKNNTVNLATIAPEQNSAIRVFKYHSDFDDGALGIFAGLSGVGTIVKNATANPKNGTTHARFTSAVGSSTWTLQDVGGSISNTNNKSEISFDFYLSVLPAATMQLIKVDDEGVSLPAANQVLVSITPTGQLQIDTNSKVFVPVLPANINAGAYHNLRVVVYAHATKGYVYVWLNDECVAILLDLVTSAGGRNAYKSMIKCITSTNPQTIDIDNYKLTEETIV